MEARILLEAALDRARVGEFHAAWTRAENNLGVLLQSTDQHADALALTAEMEALTRQRGDREWLTMARLGSITSLVELGRWREALERVREADQLQASRFARAELVGAVRVLCEQGRVDAAPDLLAEQEWQREAEHNEAVAAFAAAEARLLRAQNRPAEALAAAERGLSHSQELGMTSTVIKLCLREALEAALDLDDLTKTEELLASIDKLQPGELTHSLEAHRARFHARLDARRGNHNNVDDNYRSAEALFAEYGLAFHHAATQLEHAEWLTSQGRADDSEPLLARARETFERLEAKPWLERLDAAQAAPLAESLA